MTLLRDARQLLEPGVHDATLEEIERHFALSGRRMELFRKLKQYVADVKLTTWACTILIDGSYVMPPVVEPNDIDIILVLPADWDLSPTNFRLAIGPPQRHARELLAVVPVGGDLPLT